MIGLTILVIIIIAMMIKSTIANATKKNMNYSAFVRILMNHFQMLVLTSSLDLNWGANVGFQNNDLDDQIF
jgi:hypothetical protein